MLSREGDHRDESGDQCKRRVHKIVFNNILITDIGCGDLVVTHSRVDMNSFQVSTRTDTRIARPMHVETDMEKMMLG